MKKVILTQLRERLKEFPKETFKEGIRLIKVYESHGLSVNDTIDPTTAIDLGMLTSKERGFWVQVQNIIIAKDSIDDRHNKVPPKEEIQAAIKFLGEKTFCFGDKVHFFLAN